MINGISTDELGPQKVIYIHKPEPALEAIVVIDNIAAGPAIGGVRMSGDVTLEECARLARAMTLKNAAAGLPHGGGKSVIKADPSMPRVEKAKLIRAFAQALLDVQDYVPGPDMGTNEEAMAWVYDETGRAVGLPRELGGIPLDEIGATGHGIVSAIEAAENYSSIGIKGARIAVQGFGAVGKHAASFLAAKGAKVVAVSDSSASVLNPAGLNVAELLIFKKAGEKLIGFAGKDVETAPPEAVITSSCDILIPAARPDAITEKNVGQIKANLIVEGANIPATIEAERALHERGTLVIPDFIANAGGVICASVEYHGGTESQALSNIDEKIRCNVTQVLRMAQVENLLPRQAAVGLARERVLKASTFRRFG